MALPDVGNPLSLNDIATEFGGVAPHTLDEHGADIGLGGGAQVAISDFYGASAASPVVLYIYDGSYTGYPFWISISDDRSKFQLVADSGEASYFEVSTSDFSVVRSGQTTGTLNNPYWASGGAIYSAANKLRKMRVNGGFDIAWQKTTESSSNTTGRVITLDVNDLWVADTTNTYTIEQRVDKATGNLLSEVGIGSRAYTNLDSFSWGAGTFGQPGGTKVLYAGSFKFSVSSSYENAALLKTVGATTGTLLKGHSSLFGSLKGGGWTSQGNFYVCGGKYVGTEYKANGGLELFNSSATRLLQLMLGDPLTSGKKHTYWYSADEDSSGNVYVGGYTEKTSLITGIWDGHLAKFNAIGGLEWQVVIGKAGAVTYIRDVIEVGDYVYCYVYCNAGPYVLLGLPKDGSFSSGTINGFTVKPATLTTSTSYMNFTEQPTTFESVGVSSGTVTDHTLYANSTLSRTFTQA